MIRVAEEMKSEDDEFRNRKEAFNEFEAYVYKIKSQVEKTTELEAQSEEFINNEIQRCMDWLNSQSEDPPSEESNQMKTELQQNLEPYLEQLYPNDYGSTEKDEL